MQLFTQQEKESEGKLQALETKTLNGDIVLMYKQNMLKIIDFFTFI